MGLDVYLYHCADRATARAAEARASAATEAVWAATGDRKYEEIPQEEKDEIRAKCDAIYASENVIDYRHASVTQIELPSQLYPDHLFKIGYFRSSYNGGGINRVMDRLGLPDLYGIMGNDGKEYEQFHDWAASLESVNKVIAQYEQHLTGPMGKFRVVEIHSPLDRANSSREAMEIFEAEFARKREGSDFNSYSNGKGEFYLDGLRIFGVIPSSEPWTTAYAIVEKENLDQEDWYLQALKIMRETCEYVLAQPDPQHYYMVWSG